MRCEPWMDKTPTPKYTALELAQRDKLFWLARVQALSDELFRAEQNVIEADVTIKRLQP